MADDVLDGLLHLLDDREQPIVYRCASEPHPATRRLMASLGVRVEVGPVRVSAHQILQTRDCVAPTCLNEAETGSDHCRRHMAPTPPRVVTGVMRDVTASLRTDTRPAAIPLRERAAPVVEPIREDTNVDTWSRKPLTREQAVEKLTATLNTLDAVPTKNGWAKGLHKPSLNALIRIFGSYDDAVRACGFTPPVGLAAAKRSGGEPKGSAAGAAEAPKVAPTTEPPNDERPAATPPAVTVASPDPVAAEAGSPPDEPPPDPHAFAVLDLLALIRDLDRGDEGSGGITISRWSNDQAGEDFAAEALVRRLARAALDQADPAQIGAAVLAQLDEAA